MMFCPEEIDLAQIAAEMRLAFGEGPPAGYLPGKTTFRDFVMTKLGCSSLEAEQLVDTMIARGFLRYESTTSSQMEALAPWDIETKPSPP